MGLHREYARQGRKVVEAFQDESLNSFLEVGSILSICEYVLGARKGEEILLCGPEKTVLFAQVKLKNIVRPQLVICYSITPSTCCLE